MVNRSVRGRLRGAAAAFLVLVSAAASREAHAQSREADAERLFREGQKLMEERRFGEACPKFEAAYRKDAALGTLLNLAFCHKEQGATWYAWLEFREAEVKATELGRGDRRDFAHARLVELEKSLHKVVIDNPRKVPLTDVLVEDRKVWEAEHGAVFATESGSRKLTFRAKGKRVTSKLVELQTGSRVQHVTVPEMADLTEEDLPPPPAALVPAPAPAPPAVAPPVAPLPASSPLRTLGWVSIGVGAGAAALGITTGAISTFGPCGHAACTTAQRDSASTTAAISTGSFIAAGALVVTGIVLLVTAPSGAPATRSASLPRAWWSVAAREAPLGLSF
ncbi:MAG: hypothetical protein JWP97_5109 [Labilithrix sp.]|nr:hypothetical protein [Labilithrix sp.]